jgi:hypothetical protein
VVTYTWREDTQPPRIECPTVTSPIQCPSTPVFPEAIVVDNCDPSPRLTFEDVRIPGACPQTYRVTRTWTATDACGNSASCSATIDVVDTTAPQIVCPPVVSPIECPNTPVFPDVRVSDLCDPAPVLTFVDVTVPGACPQSYRVTRTWTATDVCGNSASCSATIDVVDTAPPRIVCPQVVSPVECPNAPVFPVPTVSDLCDPAPVLTFVDVTVPGACPQSYRVTRTWTATDVCGNSASCNATIDVVDTTPPQIVCSQVVSPVECPNDLVFPDPTVSDDCDPAPTLTFVDVTVPGSCPQNYSINRTWTATDACGNSSSCTTTIEVRDTVPPIVEWPGDVDLTCSDCNIDPANTGTPTGEDLCAPITITYTDSITGNCPKRVERRWTVSDGCNEVSNIQIIRCLPSNRVVVTDSSLCTYDLDPTTGCKEFRLLFTPNGSKSSLSKLNASNPGQTYFNLFYNGRPGTLVTLNLTIPYPYVTKGAQPIHAYDSVTVVPGPNGQECFIPGNGFFVNSTQVVLANYRPQAVGSSTVVTVTLTVPASGFVYLNMHLDYGLKGTSGYASGGSSGNDAVDPATRQVLIPNRGSYLFAFSDGTDSESDSICNINDFKKVTGIVGMVQTRSRKDDSRESARQVPGCGVVLKDAKGQVLATGKTDADGWYFCDYKWTGKSTTLFLTLKPIGGAPQTKPVTINASGCTQVDFEAP